MASARYAISIALAALASTATAATVEVEQLDRTFSPPRITIDVGDTVIWRNTSTRPHTTTSGMSGTPDGLFDSGNMEPGDTFQYTFDQPGTHDYYCDYHLPDMIGTVEVLAAGSDIVLQLVKSGVDDITLEWSNGAAPFEIFRGEARDLTDLMLHGTEPTAMTWVDGGALSEPASLLVYQVQGASTVAPTLTQIQADILTPSCAKSGCHEGAFPAMGLSLEDGLTHSQTVGVASSQQPSVMRFAPGDPDASYIIRKVEDDPSIDGAQMPRDGPPFLTQEQIDMLRAWVLDGAQDN